MVMYDVEASKTIILVNVICPKTNNQICATCVSWIFFPIHEVFLCCDLLI